MKKNPVTSKSNKKQICPLSDPSVGIISENDHKVGLCLCRYCDCGEHKCPVLDKNEIYPKSSFYSNYMKDFQKKDKVDSPLKPLQKLFTPNKHKMDLITTNQTDYKPIRIGPRKLKEKHYDSNKVQISGYSVYMNDYPNWGESQIQHEKRWDPPLRSTELSFQDKTTYKEAFHYRKSKSEDYAKGNIRSISASKSSIFFVPKDKQDYKTTYKKDMQDYSSSHLNHKVKTVPCRPLEMKIPQAHFCTTNKEYYNNSYFSPNPRLYKYSLIARSQSTNKNKAKKRLWPKIN